MAYRAARSISTVRKSLQTRRTFGGLARGKHIFELIVTGKKDGAATAPNVDIDELIVR